MTNPLVCGLDGKPCEPDCALFSPCRRNLTPEEQKQWDDPDRALVYRGNLMRRKRREKLGREISFEDVVDAVRRLEKRVKALEASDAKQEESFKKNDLLRRVQVLEDLAHPK